MLEGTYNRKGFVEKMVYVVLGIIACAIVLTIALAMIRGGV